MIFINSYPVRGGDCFLIKHKGKNILIDSGYKTTSDRLIKDLKEMSMKGEIIDLLIITHIDNDHIGGAIKLFQENNTISINEIWYNGYKQVFDINEKFEETSRDSQIKIKNIISNNTVKYEEDNENIGYEEAQSFEELLFENNIIINKSFNGKLILSKMKMNLSENIEFIFLSPTIDEIKELRSEWEEVLQQNDIYDEKMNIKNMPKAFEFYNINREIDESYIGEISVENKNSEIIEDMAKTEITSRTTRINDTSLAFILRIDSTNLLFLGDSNHNVVLRELKELTKLDEKYKKIKLMKVSHHGSKNNINNELLSIIETESFLFSTDGSPKKNGISSKPHIETISKIIVKEKKSNLYFNYPQDKYNKSIFDAIDRCNNDDLYNVKTICGDGVNPLEISINN